MPRLSVSDLVHDPGELARSLPEWQRGDLDEAVAATLGASSRSLHDRAYTCWIWTGTSLAGDPVWLLPVTAQTTREFAPRGPALVLARLVAAAVDAGARPAEIGVRAWRGLTLLVAPGLDPSLADDAVAMVTAPPARASVVALPHDFAPDGDPLALGGAPPRAATALAPLSTATHVHPLRVVLALASHGQPVDEDAYPPELVTSLREWGCHGEAPPPPAPSLEIDDDPCPLRRHARRVLRRLLGMKKIGEQYHTAADHLYRSAAPHERDTAIRVGEALIRAGLLGEKPSVGQRHVYLRREALPAIHALIDRGETRHPELAALWTAPPPGGIPD